MQGFICTTHNLKFSFDAERVRALGTEPAYMRCPLCTHEKMALQREQLEQLSQHNKLLVSSIKLVKQLQEDDQ